MIRLFDIRNSLLFFQSDGQRKIIVCLSWCQMSVEATILMKTTGCAGSKISG